AFLESLDAALRRPVWTLSLGRKAFVPALPVAEGVCDGELMDELRGRLPWTARGHEAPPDRLRYVIESEAYGQGEPRADVRRSFVRRERRFALRHVRTEFHPPPSPEPPHVP